MDQVDTQQELLEHAQRQTKALENISLAVMVLLVIGIIGLVAGLLLVTGSGS